MAFCSSPASEKIWVSRHTDQVNLHPGHQPGVPGVGVGVVVFLWVHCVLFWQVVGLLVCSLPKCSAFSEQHILVRGKCGAIQGLVRESNSPSSGKMRDHGQSPKFWPRGWKNMYHFAFCPPKKSDLPTGWSLSDEGFLPRNPRPLSANHPRLFF